MAYPKFYEDIRLRGIPTQGETRSHMENIMTKLDCLSQSFIRSFPFNWIKRHRELFMVAPKVHAKYLMVWAMGNLSPLSCFERQKWTNHI